MNNKNKWIIFLLLLTSTTNAKTTSTITSEKETKSINGIYYALPQTTIRLRITTIHTWHLQGPYYRFAERYLGEENIITENTDYWSIQSIEISTFSSPNPEQVFQLKTSNKSALNQITLANASISLLNNSSVNIEEDVQQTSKINFSIPDFHFNKSALSEEVLVALSSAKQAELTAKLIYRIRENRLSLLTGDLDFPSDGESLSLMLSEMNSMERSLLELFIGKRASSTYTTEIDYLPTKNSKEILFRFSEQEGIVDKNDLSGTPFYIEITSKKLPLNLSLKQKKGAIAYIQPATTLVNIYNDKESLIQTTLNIPQLGDILWLPTKFLRKASSTSFQPSTGQLIQISTTK